MEKLPEMQISTIHSFCRRILNDYPLESGVGFAPQFESEEGAHGGYLLYGDEDHLKRDALAQIRKAALKDCPPGLEDFNRNVFAPQDDDFSDVSGAIMSMPVMAERRLVEFVPPSFVTLMKGRRVKDDADGSGEKESADGEETGIAAGLKKFLAAIEVLPMRRRLCSSRSAGAKILTPEPRKNRLLC